jgi:hypothetical protein
VGKPSCFVHAQLGLRSPSGISQAGPAGGGGSTALLGGPLTVLRGADGGHDGACGLYAGIAAAGGVPPGHSLQWFFGPALSLPFLNGAGGLAYDIEYECGVREHWDMAGGDFGRGGLHTLRGEALQLGINRAVLGANDVPAACWSNTLGTASVVASTPASASARIILIDSGRIVSATAGPTP